MQQQSEPKSLWKLVTPEIAKDWLRYNKRNRATKVASIDRYSRDMRAHRWRENGESIKFDTSGYLVDGQNRLHACVKANTAFRTLVIRGVLPDVRGTVDANVPVTFADLLSMDGVKYGSVVQAVCRLICMERDGHLNTIGSYKPSMDELQDVYKEFKDRLRGNIRVGTACGRLLPKSQAAYLHNRLSRINAAEADMFFLELATGTNLTENDPVRRLREKLIQIKLKQRGQLTRREIMSLVYRAWNARREGRVITRPLAFSKVRTPEQKAKAKRRGVAPTTISVPQPI